MTLRGKYEGKTIGWGPWKMAWHSICSIHGGEYGTSCPLCMTGRYHLIWRTAISKFIFKVSPRVWVWYANRPYLNKNRRFIEEVFPNLKGTNEEL